MPGRYKTNFQLLGYEQELCQTILPTFDMKIVYGFNQYTRLDQNLLFEYLLLISL